MYSFGVVVKAYYQSGLLYTFSMVPDADVKHAFYVYLFTKHLELLDTVFMILRHRQRQITFLHVSGSYTFHITRGGDKVLTSLLVTGNGYLPYISCIHTVRHIY